MFTSEMILKIPLIEGDDFESDILPIKFLMAILQELESYMHDPSDHGIDLQEINDIFLAARTVIENNPTTNWYGGEGELDEED